MTPKFEDAIAIINKAWEGRKDATNYPDYDDINTAIGSLEKAVKILGILKDYADTSVERTDFNFKTGEEYEYTAIVIELANDGGIDYKAIKEWLEENE